MRVFEQTVAWYRCALLSSPRARSLATVTHVRHVLRSNDQGDLVVTKGDQYDVREAGTEEGKGDVRNLGKPVELSGRYVRYGMYGYRGVFGSYSVCACAVAGGAAGFLPHRPNYGFTHFQCVFDSFGAAVGPVIVIVCHRRKRS